MLNQTVLLEKCQTKMRLKMHCRGPSFLGNSFSIFITNNLMATGQLKNANLRKFNHRIAKILRIKFYAKHCYDNHLIKQHHFYKVNHGSNEAFKNATLKMQAYTVCRINELASESLTNTIAKAYQTPNTHDRKKEIFQNFAGFFN